MSQVSYQKWTVGAHTSFNGKIYDTLKHGIDYGMYAIQFFLGNPKGFNRSRVTDEDVNKSNRILRRFPLHVFTHFPYIANLSGSKEILAWNGDYNMDKKVEIVLDGVQYELDTLNKLDCKSSGVVIHPGNHIDREKGLEKVSQSINKLKFTGKSKLLLENSAGQGTSLVTTFSEIKTIIDRIDRDKVEHIGVCIDTCHIYAYGMYDLSNKEEVYRMFKDFDEKIGAEKFKLLHLNDSQCPMGSRKDRHACLGTGLIWGKSFDSLICLLDECEKREIPIVLETHDMDMVTLASL